MNKKSLFFIIMSFMLIVLFPSPIEAKSVRVETDKCIYYHDDLTSLSPGNFYIFSYEAKVGETYYAVCDGGDTSVFTEEKNDIINVNCGETYQIISNNKWQFNYPVVSSNIGICEGDTESDYTGNGESAGECEYRLNGYPNINLNSDSWKDYFNFSNMPSQMYYGVVNGNYFFLPVTSDSVTNMYIKNFLNFEYAGDKIANKTSKKCKINIVMDVEEDDAVVETAEYSCSYKGKVNNKSLNLTKYQSYWTVSYPNGTKKNISVEDTKGNLFPTKNCDDVFYSTKDNVIMMTDATSKYADLHVKQFCKNYSDLEQFCQNGACKIDNALCGNSTASKTGDCPEELRPILVFIKRVVFNTLQIFVPIILILMGSIDMVRAVLSNEDKGMKETTSRFIRRILSALLVFFVTTIVIVVMDMFAKVDDVGKQEDWKACWIDIE